ncbi:MAG TPA: heme exporter protein CcmD [Gammaproteobacteria bacterium]|jgi:heme exporter protein D|nr:heme exporter protein CcmD [Gammaproteobacteria bacterium]HAY41653.1 heme exporter protein CcmD [Gammaproteobacteria bacterium]
MTIVEYFSFLPFGKNAFYIWLSYSVVLIVIAILFIRTKSIHKSVMSQLNVKYSRES